MKITSLQQTFYSIIFIQFGPNRKAAVYDTLIIYEPIFSSIFCPLSIPMTIFSLSTRIFQPHFWVLASHFFPKEMYEARSSGSRLVYPKSVLGHITSSQPPRLNLCSEFEKYTGILCIISAKSPFAAA